MQRKRNGYDIRDDPGQTSHGIRRPPQTCPRLFQHAVLQSDSDKPAPTSNAIIKWLVVLLAAIFVFYAVTIRVGHRWGDDYALYVHHAKNIATGIPYANTGYIADPYYPWYSVRMTPPIFPLVVAPVYKIFGMNFTAFKIIEVLFFVATLALVFVLFREYLSPAYTLFLVALLGFSPFFWRVKDDVLSDIPFMFFVLLTVLLVSKHKPPVLCGFVAYLAIGTRTVGIVLLPAIFVHELLRNKRITKYPIILILTSAVLLLLQLLALHGDAASSYTDLLQPTLQTVLANLWRYPLSLGSFWHTPLLWLTGLTHVAVLLAFIKGVPGRQPVFWSVFVCFYGATLLMWPGTQELRYLIPLLPLFLFYACRGLERLAGAATIVICSLLLVGYLLQYRAQNFSVIAEANGRETFVAMCSFVNSNTMPTDRIVFNRARSLSLFADRPASPYHQPANPNDLWKYFNDQGIRYVIISSLFEKDRNVLAPVLERHKTELDLKYRNAEFMVYQIRK
jgi:hypothetical protein